jgi:hypothetical protein
LIPTQLTLKSLNSLVYEKISHGKFNANDYRIKILSTSFCASDYSRIKEGKIHIYPIVLGMVLRAWLYHIWQKFIFRIQVFSFLIEIKTNHQKVQKIKRQKLDFSVDDNKPLYISS